MAGNDSGQMSRQWTVRLDEPVVVLAYPQSGVGRLMSIVSQRPDIWLKAQAHLVQMCHHMGRAWVAAEDSPGSRLSRLAAASIRSVLSSMITAGCAATGATRWWSLALSAPEAATTFAEIYPKARFICFYRECTDTIYAGLAACPWGLSGYGFEAFAAAYPGKNVAALADYWAAHTEPILDFEQVYADRAIRIRYEDFATETDTTLKNIYDFLGMEQLMREFTLPDPWHPSGNTDDTDLHSPDNRQSHTSVTPDGLGLGLGRQIPILDIPEHLRIRIDSLHSRLGYPELRDTAR